ncbi:MAG: CHAT domain-containing protein [Armatimonadetes bacterium]|nr:CHAT domain-containing protein [Armatimonadota bacterium]
MARRLRMLLLILALLVPCARADPDAGDLKRKCKELEEAGRYAEGLPLAENMLSLCEAEHGPEHPRTADALVLVGDFCLDLGDFPRAEPLYLRALAIREKVRGPRHADVSYSLNRLGLLYCHMGRYGEAEKFYLRDLKLTGELWGAESESMASALNNLGGLYGETGELARAETFYERALDLDKKIRGQRHPSTLIAMNNLGCTYLDRGDYARAEALLQQTLGIREKTLGPEHPDTACSLLNLARLYQDIGDFARAEPLYQRSLAIDEKTLGAEHYDTATRLSSLAVLYQDMQEYARAEPLLRRAIEIYEKRLGPEHPWTAILLNNLADLHEEQGDYAGAEPLYRRALAIREKVLSPVHLDRASSLASLGWLYRKMGRYGEAEPLCWRALKIREQAAGPDHPDTARSLNHMAVIELRLGHREQALELAVRSLRATEIALGNVLSFSSERQRLAFAARVDPYSVLAAVGSGPEIALAVLRNKGLVLDSLLEDRLLATVTGQAALVQQLWEARERLQRERSENAPEQGALERQVEHLEGELARKVVGSAGGTRRALSVTVEQVQAALSPDTALIEYLRYDDLSGNQPNYHYGAVILRPGSAPVWVPLGPATEIDDLIRNYRSSLRGTDDPALARALHGLYDKLWRPLAEHLPAPVKTVILCPDGSLSFVSMATLLTPDERFLGEAYSILYVASGRDLLLPTPSGGPALKLAAFGNPDFESSSGRPESPVVATRAVDEKDLRSLGFGPLPGTAAECAAIEEVTRQAGWTVEVYLDKAAGEPQFRQLTAPGILHVATHGFFLTSHKNPMRRSGLALAGAQATVKAWKDGRTPPPESDGILTAEEVGGARLDGTWLAALSACNTGIGEARAGEGVLGLRRGFVQAGAQNLLMTLWPVSDQTTAQFMIDFYQRATRDHTHVPHVLAATQGEWLVRLRREHGLVSAVQLAGPFLVTFRGLP